MKRYFPVPFITFLALTSFYAIYQIWIGEAQLAWLASLLTALPMLSFFIAIGVVDIPRSSRYLPIQLTFTVLGVVLSLVEYQQWLPLILSLSAAIGNCLYIFWYTPLDRQGSQIVVGKALPKFTLYDTHNQVIDLKKLAGGYQLLLFIRANWCPLCVAQVKELAEQYQQLQGVNCETFIISSQSEKETERLAKKLNVPIHFAVDKNNQAANALGIEHVGGTPFGIPGFEANTALPTAIIIAPNQQVIFAHQTDDYRLRPEPETFIKAIVEHQTQV